MLKDKVVFVGVGQAGGNIAKEFDSLGYKTFFINTSVEDLKVINVPDEQKYHIPYTSGCAKDRDKAIALTVKHHEQMVRLVNDKFPYATIMFFCYSLGGGTGSGIGNTLIEISKSMYPERYFNSITVYPKLNSSIQVLDNAKACLKQLVDAMDEGSISSAHVLDNSSRDDILKINREFATLLDRFLSFDETTSKGNLDEEDIFKIVTDSGFSVLLDIEEDSDFRVSSVKAMENSIYCKWTQNVNYLGMILNQTNISKDPLADVEEVFGIPMSDFTTYSEEESSIILASGLSENRELLRSLVKSAKEKLKKKSELESNQDNSEDNDEDLDLNLNLGSAKRKKAAPKNFNKSLNDILNKYSNK